MRRIDWNGDLPGAWRLLDAEGVPASDVTVRVLCHGDRYRLDRDLDRSRYLIEPKVSR